MRSPKGRGGSVHTGDSDSGKANANHFDDVVGFLLVGYTVEVGWKFGYN